MSAHDTSDAYNQLNVRVDKWDINGNEFRIHTSRTSYFNSLVANRAMDYQYSKGMSVRELLEYGPVLHLLEESYLSNHLGFNGFIESADGYIVFVKRHHKLSIAKNTYGDSIGASLKVKYAIDENGNI